MVFDWATTGPYEGHTVTFIETYKDYKIYFCTGPGGLYGFVDPDGNELSHWTETLEDARALIDEWVGELPDGNGATTLGGLGLLVLLYLIFGGK